MLKLVFHVMYLKIDDDDDGVDDVQYPCTHSNG